MPGAAQHSAWAADERHGRPLVVALARCATGTVPTVAADDSGSSSGRWRPRSARTRAVRDGRRDRRGRRNRIAHPRALAVVLARCDTRPMSPRAVLLAGLAICAFAASAHAATSEPVEVARTGDIAVFAGDDSDKDLCISIHDYGENCAGRNESVATVDGPTPEALYLGAAVPAAATSIEVRRAGALLVTGPTVAGAAYKGLRAGSVRFALVRLPKDVKTDGLRVRALSAGGALVDALAPDDDPELVLGRTRLLSGRSGSTRWKIVAEDLSELTPSILDPEHETRARCVVTFLDSLDRGRACSTGLLQAEIGLSISRAAGAETCNAPFRLLHGVVAGGVTSVVILLGDGRRRTVPTVPVGDGRRTYAVPTGQGAVRSVTLEGGSVIRPALAPMSAVCAGGGQGLKFFDFGSSALGIFALLAESPPVTPVGPVTTIPGSPPIQVADGPADTLCVAIAGRPFDGFGCAIIPPREPQGTFDSLLAPHAFAVTVPASVAGVRFGTADGKVVRTVATSAGAEYRGRYAGRVRFAAASISGFAELARFELLDAAGTVVYDDNTEAGDGEDFFVLPRVGRARRIAGRAGGPSLWQTNAHYGELVDRCLALTQGLPPGPLDNCQTSGQNTTVLLEASCVTKRLSAGFVVRPGTRVFADTGRKLKRPVRLRRGVGVLTLPPGRPLRSLTLIRGKERRHVPIGAPAGAKQCGWHLAPSIDV